MENNETKTFGNKAEKSDKGKKINKNTEDVKLAGASAFGGVVGGGISTVATEIRYSQEENEPESRDPQETQEVVNEIDPENVSNGQVSEDHVDPVVSEPTPDPTSEPAPAPIPEPTRTPAPASDPVPDPVPEIDAEEPVLPVEEIDPLDNDIADVIEDVTNVEVVYDINGNPMIVATAHNSVDGEFYLVDADVDGDFDVILDGMGNPVADLTGANDQLVTVTDVEAQMNDNYIAPTDTDNLIAQQNMIGENIQQDIIIVDDNIA